jgi:endoglucanase
MSGIQTENTADAGGGLNVGWQENNDWMDYAVNLPSTGVYTLNFRVATPNTGVQFQLRNSNGTALTTVTVPNTTWWQTWQTFSVLVNLPAGAQTLRIYTTDAKGSGWNINWWEITPGSNITNQPPVVSAGSDQSITLPVNIVSLNGSATDADGQIASYLWSQVSGPSNASFSNATATATSASGLQAGTYVFRLKATDNLGLSATDDVTVIVNPGIGNVLHIEAENYSAMSGIQTENVADIGGGLDVGWQENGDWMDYNVNVPSTDTYTLRFRVSTVNTGVKFQLRRSNGTIISTLTVPNTGWWQSWQTFTAQVNLHSGQQTIRIYTQDAKGTGWNLNWWEIVLPDAGAITMARTDIPGESQAAVPSLEVYPNPVRDNVKLTLDNELNGDIHLQVANMGGVIRKQLTITKPQRGYFETSVSLGDLPRGEYLLILSQGNWREVRKLIKL